MPERREMDGIAMVMKLRRNKTRDYKPDLDKEQEKLNTITSTYLDTALFNLLGKEYSHCNPIEDQYGLEEAKALQNKQVDLEIHFENGVIVYGEHKSDYANNNEFQFELLHTYTQPQKYEREGWFERAVKSETTISMANNR